MYVFDGQLLGVIWGLRAELRLSSGVAGQAFKCVRVDGGGKLLAWHAQNETAWVSGAAFGFSAHLTAPC